MSRDVACVSYLGHAEIEGSEPSPGMFSQMYDQQYQALFHLSSEQYPPRGGVQIRNLGIQKALGALDVCSRAFGPLARLEATPSPRCPGLAVVRDSDALS